jgi:acylglycerol lipase
VRRFPAALILAFFLAGCAPRVIGLGLENVSPSLAASAYIARDGANHTMQSWAAPAPQAIIVALHGMNDYANAFAMPAPWWAERGITIYAYDQRGFGRSKDPGLWADNDVVLEDLGDFIEIVRGKHPGVPVFLLGESMGGAVATAAMGEGNAPKVDGLVLVAPAYWGWSSLNFLYRATLWASAHTIPWMVFTGSDLKLTPSDNIEMLRAYVRDPLVIKGARTDAVYGLVSMMERGYQGAAKVKVPTLILLGKKDEIVPRDPVIAAAKVWGEKPRVALYENGYHMLMRDLQRERVWADVLSFVKDQSAPLPSGEEVKLDDIEPSS